jgi:hypothetical protein
MDTLLDLIRHFQAFELMRTQKELYVYLLLTLIL